MLLYFQLHSPSRDITLWAGLIYWHDVRRASSQAAAMKEERRPFVL